jgi:ClpP class serine protease
MATVSPAEQAILPSFTRHYVKDGIGVIPVKGFLSSDILDWFGLSYAQLQSVLKKFEDDSDVKGVLLTLDSCGGDAAGAFEFAELVNNFPKPIETYIEAEASSAGYLIAAATKFITMHKSAFAGSIGAVVSAYKWDDVQSKTIVNTQSPFKYADPFDDNGEQRIRNHLDQIANVFINDVARYRKTDAGNIQNNYGQGDVLFAKQALSVGMIDSVGNLQTALTHLMNTINPEGKDNPDNDSENKKTEKNNLRSNLKTGAKKLKRGKRRMANRRIKTAFVLIDDSEIPE